MIKGDSSRKVSIICEGSEEYDYICRLKELHIFNPTYSVRPKNAKGIDHIFSIYTNEFQNNNSEIVLVFCDTELPPYKKFEGLKKKINGFHSKRAASDMIVYFANPCTMQIMLMHFTDIKLKTNSKTTNAVAIYAATGIKDYQAEEAQRHAFMNHINIDNYKDMKSNLLRLPNDYKSISSTNFITLMNNLENSDTGWIDRINKKIM